MRRQREQAATADRRTGDRSPVRVRLTDQALVAVTLARSADGPATVAHLLVGLASEPDGRAALVLRRHDAAAARLAGRLSTAPARLAALEVALGWAAREVAHRPLWTTDLLAAGLEVGGADLHELLEACGLEPADLAIQPPDMLSPREALQDVAALTETHGYDPADAAWTPPAARALARARALGGSAAALVVALAAEQAVAPDDVPLKPAELEGRLRRWGALSELARPNRADRGLDVVADAARRSRRHGGPVSPTDLLRAAVLVGGERPAFLLVPRGDA